MSEQIEQEVLEMDALLRRTAGALPFPPTPPIADAVEARLRAPKPPALWERARGLAERWWHVPAIRLVGAGLAVALLFIGAALAVPRSREALADFFGLSGVQVAVQPGAELPPVQPLDAFAERTTLESARQVADFELRLPSYPETIGPPDAVFLQRFGDDTIVIVSYTAEGFDLHQSPLRAGSFSKLVPEEVIELRVAGGDAIWIDAGGHLASYVDGNGDVVPGSRRTVERATLLWEQGGITYRLETSLSMNEAVLVAESLR